MGVLVRVDDGHVLVDAKHVEGMEHGVGHGIDVHGADTVLDGIEGEGLYLVVDDFVLELFHLPVDREVGVLPADVEAVPGVRVDGEVEAFEGDVGATSRPTPGP